MKCASSESIELLFNANLFDNINITGLQVWDTKKNKEWCLINLESMVKEEQHFEEFWLVRLKLQKLQLESNRTYDIRIIVDDPGGGKPIIFTIVGVQTKGQCITVCFISNKFILIIIIENCDYLIHFFRLVTFFSFL